MQLAAYERNVHTFFAVFSRTGTASPISDNQSSNILCFCGFFSCTQHKYPSCMASFFTVVVSPNSIAFSIIAITGQNRYSYLATVDSKAFQGRKFCGFHSLLYIYPSTNVFQCTYHAKIFFPVYITRPNTQNFSSDYRFKLATVNDSLLRILLQLYGNHFNIHLIFTITSKQCK